MATGGPAFKGSLSPPPCHYLDLFSVVPSSNPPSRFVYSQLVCLLTVRIFIAVFNNMRTLKFKPHPTVYVFRCRQTSKQTSQKTEAHFNGVKRSRLSVVIGRFRSVLFVSVFQCLLAVAIILIDSRENPNRQALNFRVCMLLKGAIT